MYVSNLQNKSMLTFEKLIYCFVETISSGVSANGSGIAAVGDF
jgi:hypothetical protein